MEVKKFTNILRILYLALVKNTSSQINNSIKYISDTYYDLLLEDNIISDRTTVINSTVHLCQLTALEVHNKASLESTRA